MGGNALTSLNVLQSSTLTHGYCLCTWTFLGQCGGAVLGTFTSLLNNSGIDLTRLPFPPSVMYSRLFGTLHQRPGMNSSVPCHELWAPALCLMTVSINTLLLSSSRSYSKGKKTLITLWHQMSNSRTCMRISGGYWKTLLFPFTTFLSLKPLKLARYPLPSNWALLSPTMHLEHSHGCCYFGPIIKLNAALMAVLELMSSAELAAPWPAFCPAIRKIRQWKISQGLWRVRLKFWMKLFLLHLYQKKHGYISLFGLRDHHQSLLTTTNM